MMKMNLLVLKVSDSFQTVDRHLLVIEYQLENQNVLVILTADHECGGLAVHDGDEGNLDIKFTSDYHSANFVPIWASGPGASFFDSMMDNTMIGKQLIKYVKER